MNCKGCNKDITGFWNFDGYGWCCVQHWRKKPTIFERIRAKVKHVGVNGK